MSGYVAIHRAVFTHPTFKKEPFSERLAWMWLISEAAWKPTRKRVGKTVFDLQRGQCVHALRFMAEAWLWDKNRVVRFLARLRDDSMVTTSAGRDATLITICNYDEYQSRRDTDAPENGTQTGRERDKLEEDNNSKNTDTAAEPYLAGAKLLVEKIEEAVGIDARFIPPEWCGATHRVEMWLRQGWREDIILSSIKAQAARKQSPPTRIQYYEKGIADAHASAAAPIPEGKVIPIQGSHNGKTGNVIAAADKLVERIAEFNRPAPGGIRCIEGKASIRTGPKG